MSLKNLTKKRDFLHEIVIMFKRIMFLLTAKRLGPDMPLTHLLLYSKRLSQWICKRRFATFGAGSEFRPGAYAINSDQIFIGSKVTIRPGTMLFASHYTEGVRQIVIEDKALIGAGVHIYVSNHRFSDVSKPIYDQGHEDVKPVIISTGCWIGANAIILPGVRIGKNAVIGAGSIVTKSIPDFAVAVGNPARVIRSQLTAENNRS
jgi:acetyltransferase-like isoleucine patch superfamily enzyme